MNNMLKRKNKLTQELDMLESKLSNPMAQNIHQNYRQLYYFQNLTRLTIHFDHLKLTKEGINVFDHLFLPSSLKEIYLIFESFDEKIIQEWKENNMFIQSLSKIQSIQSLKLEFLTQSNTQQFLLRTFYNNFINTLLSSTNQTLEALSIILPPLIGLNTKIIETLATKNNLKFFNLDCQIYIEPEVRNIVSNFQGNLKQLKINSTIIPIHFFKIESLKSLTSLEIILSIASIISIKSHIMRTFYVLDQIENLETLTIIFNSTYTNQLGDLGEKILKYLKTWRKIKRMEITIGIKISEEIVNKILEACKSNETLEIAQLKLGKFLVTKDSKGTMID